jgi:hypothetical protein
MENQLAEIRACLLHVIHKLLVHIYLRNYTRSLKLTICHEFHIQICMTELDT